MRHSAWLLATVLCFGGTLAACGSSDETPTETGGAGGQAGKGGAAGKGGTGGMAGTGGTAGKAGTGGTAGTAGKGGTAGTAGTAGKGGTAGTAGKGGTAGTAGTAGAGGTGGCSAPTDCPDPANECVDRTCTSGTCGTAPKAQGTATASQTALDCKKNQCDGAGAIESVNDDADLPDDANDCTNDVCTSGTPSNPPKDKDAACGTGGTMFCDGAGKCVGCTAASQCTAGPCKVATCDLGTCGTTNEVDGTACNDTNACTQTDTCAAGVCTGSNPIVCKAIDTCHDVGVCDTGTGVCSDPVLADGTACNDGNACTQTDTCASGVCGGANPVTCTALDACHVVGVCDQGTGVCSNPNAPDGTTCTSGGMSGKCSAGSCVTDVLDTCPGNGVALTQQSTFVWHGTASGDTSTLTADYGSATGSCAVTSSAAGRDAVYRFTAPAAGTATVKIPTASYDSVLYAREGDCATGTQVKCSDAIGDGGENISFPVTANSQYWLFVDGYGSTESGTYTLDVQVTLPGCGNGIVETGEGCDDGNTTDGDGCDHLCALEPPGPNDTCPGASLALTQSGSSWTGTVSSTTVNLTGTYSGTCGSTSTSKEAVYLIHPTVAGPATVKITAASFDSVLYVRSGACNPGTQVGCNDGAGLGGDTVSFTAAANTDYWIFVDGYSGAQGSFTLNVTIVPPVCGNGTIEAGEGCDDGALVNGDGCSSVCVVENGFACNGQPSVCFAFESNCSDSIDNDNDGQIDMVDDDCIVTANFPPCGSGSTRRVYRSTGAAQAIPDNSAAGITNTISVAGVTGTVTRAAVVLNVTHTWDSDVDMFLTPPGGTAVDICTDNGSSGANYVKTVLDSTCSANVTSGTAPFTGCYKPENTIPTTTANGDWVLKVADDSSGDTGTLDSWALVLCTTP
ncbi:MAG: proprotein convertase P-domain-containing protein [Deltaproteobacteria bacterium]|nr:proprotein convertase P-domain-containing protein [Deltaproteobacteria bacterium]